MRNMDQTNLLNSDKLTKGSLFTVILPMSYNVPGGSTVDVNVSCDRAGYVALGIIGVSGLVANCEARQFHINDNNVSISIYNRATSAQSGSGTVRVLYRAE